VGKGKASRETWRLGDFRQETDGARMTVLCTCRWSPVNTATIDPPHIVAADPACPVHHAECPDVDEKPPWHIDPWNYSAWDGHRFGDEEMACGRCKFWERTEISWGECRRLAPRAFNENNLASWPDTENYDWCGDFVLIADADRQGHRRRI
jgi:hypothetical protein